MKPEQQLEPEQKLKSQEELEAEANSGSEENSTPEEKLHAKGTSSKKKVVDWKGDLGRLINLGPILDLPTAKERYCKTDPITREKRIPLERDGWIEEYLRIRTKKSGLIPFVLNRAQREYSARSTKQNIVLKARQVGITTYVAAKLFLQTITRRGTLTMQVAHDREAAEEIFRIVHRFWDNLPEQWQKGALKTSHSSARELVFPRLDSEYTVTSAGENAGRGRTIQNLHCTEVSRWGREGEEALASLRAAVVPGGEIVLESTANGAWGLFYQEWQQAEETGYTRHFFPWWYEESYQVDIGKSILLLNEEETALVNEHGLTAKQIAWRRRQWAALRGLAAQEFAEDAVSCFRASGECVFELAAVETALAGALEPVERRDNGRVNVWLPAQSGKEYVIGVDPAGGGTEGDYSCAEVIEWKTGAQCAELHGHYNPRELAKELVKLGEEYNRALVAVERNNHGHSVLAQLENRNYLNLFKQNGHQGWETNVVSRPVMIEGLSAALMEAPTAFRSQRLLEECRTFVRSVDGRTGAASGSHDDCVIAMAIAWAVRAEEMGKKRWQMGLDSLAN